MKIFPFYRRVIPGNFRFLIYITFYLILSHPFISYSEQSANLQANLVRWRESGSFTTSASFRMLSPVESPPLSSKNGLISLPLGENWRFQILHVHYENGESFRLYINAKSKVRVVKGQVFDRSGRAIPQEKMQLVVYLPGGRIERYRFITDSSGSYRYSLRGLEDAAFVVTPINPLQLVSNVSLKDGELQQDFLKPTVIEQQNSPPTEFSEGPVAAIDGTTCGDCIVQRGEACDPGVCSPGVNTSCNASCTYELQCGNNIIFSGLCNPCVGPLPGVGPEECDPPDGVTCAANCRKIPDKTPTVASSVTPGAFPTSGSQPTTISTQPPKSSPTTAKATSTIIAPISPTATKVPTIAKTNIPTPLPTITKTVVVAPTFTPIKTSTPTKIPTPAKTTTPKATYTNTPRNTPTNTPTPELPECSGIGDDDSCSDGQVCCRISATDKFACVPPGHGDPIFEDNLQPPCAMTNCDPWADVDLISPLINSCQMELPPNDIVEQGDTIVFDANATIAKFRAGCVEFCDIRYPDRNGTMVVERIPAISGSVFVQRRTYPKQTTEYSMSCSGINGKTAYDSQIAYSCQTHELEDPERDFPDHEEKMAVFKEVEGTTGDIVDYIFAYGPKQQIGNSSRQQILIAMMNLSKSLYDWSMFNNKVPVRKSDLDVLTEIYNPATGKSLVSFEWYDVRPGPDFICWGINWSELVNPIRVRAYVIETPTSKIIYKQPWGDGSCPFTTPREDIDNWIPFNVVPPTFDTATAMRDYDAEVEAAARAVVVFEFLLYSIPFGESMDHLSNGNYTQAGVAFGRDAVGLLAGGFITKPGTALFKAANFADNAFAVGDTGRAVYGIYQDPENPGAELGLIALHTPKGIAILRGIRSARGSVGPRVNAEDLVGARRMMERTHARGRYPRLGHILIDPLKAPFTARERFLYIEGFEKLSSITKAAKEDPFRAVQRLRDEIPAQWDSIRINRIPYDPVTGNGAVVINASDIENIRRISDPVKRRQALENWWDREGDGLLYWLKADYSMENRTLNMTDRILVKKSVLKPDGTRVNVIEDLVDDGEGGVTRFLQEEFAKINIEEYVHASGFRIRSNGIVYMSPYSEDFHDWAVKRGILFENNNNFYPEADIMAWFQYHGVTMRQAEVSRYLLQRGAFQTFYNEVILPRIQ